MCEIAVKRGVDAPGALPVVSATSPTPGPPDDVTHPVTLGWYSGVIDPHERDRILCDSVIVPVIDEPSG